MRYASREGHNWHQGGILELNPLERVFVPRITVEGLLTESRRGRVEGGRHCPHWTDKEGRLLGHSRPINLVLGLQERGHRVAVPRGGLTAQVGFLEGEAGVEWAEAALARRAEVKALEVRRRKVSAAINCCAYLLHQTLFAA